MCLKVVCLRHQPIDEVPPHTELCHRFVDMMFDDVHVDNKKVNQTKVQARPRPAFADELEFVLGRAQLVVHVDTAQFFTTYFHHARARYRVFVSAHAPLDRFVFCTKVGRYTPNKGTVVPHTRI